MSSDGPGVIGAVVLCGGSSRRMGRPKATLPFGGESLLERVVARIAREVEVARIVVVAAPGQEIPALSRGVAVVHDAIEGRGPLAGLAAGLRGTPHEVDLVYASAVDAPFLADGWIGRLAGWIGAADAAIPDVEGRRHPLAAIYRRGPTLAAAEALLAQGRSRLLDLSESLTARLVSADELVDVDPGFATLRNLNTPADYEAAVREADRDVH